MLKRFTTLFLTLVLVVCMIPLALPVSAAYENTHVNTGNQRYDIIQVALTQVGYQEGSNNYTKYGQHYGWPNTAWCGWFVSWCANEAGVPRSVLKQQGIAGVSNFGLTKFYANEKTPQSGDLYFKSGHVGLVYKVEGNYFWSVEGNSNDQVEIEKFDMRKDNYKKYWFASPNYSGSNNASHTHSTETGYDSAHPHKEYKKCTSCDYKTYTGNQKSVEDCAECIQENCSHEYGSWSSSSDSKHKKSCTKCGKEITESHDWEYVKTIKEPTCGTKGTELQKCSDCGKERNSSIPTTNDHSYGDWDFSDDKQHSRKCQVCGKKTSKDHKVDSDDPWRSTETEHWQECIVCEKQFQLEEHTFGDSCVDPCEDCGYVRPEGHPFSDTWETDAESHWRKCTACGELSVKDPHIYSAACDEDCDECGYVREVEHSYPETMDTDGVSHWFECDVCGKINGMGKHIPGAQATEENPQLCTVCNVVLVEQIVHVHDFGPYQSNSQTHWGTCRCGLELSPTAHSWDMATGKCSLCGVASVAQAETRNWDLVWLGIGVAVFCTAIVTTSVMVHNRKKRKAMEGDPYWA